MDRKKFPEKFKKIYFNSIDGLKITADYYPVLRPKDLIVLCHRSHCNRAEYRETAVKLNGFGYSCLALDQRSGMKVWGEINETKIRAKEKNLPTGYLDARPDIEAAVEYAYQLNNGKKIILFGSSYSASLAMLIAVNSKMIKAVIGFSPGEFLKGIHIAESIGSIKVPVFVSSAKTEITQVSRLVKNIDPKFVDQFKPRVDGFHGSKTLWESISGSETYWHALKEFLKTLK